MIPTHNPNMETLGKVLDALRRQTLPLAEWELIVIDNASNPPLEKRIDLGWHPRSRCLQEKRRGVFHARSRGLRECRGRIIIGVDDDNVLDPNYVAEALRIAEEWPALGAWGGQIKPVWEAPPSDDMLPWIQHLALCEFDTPAWSSFVHDWTVPYGAGMCVRSEVVPAFLEGRSARALSTRFGRNGRSMVSGEDQLLAYAATTMGLGVGKFPSLVLHHLIPRQRVDPDYLVKAAQGNSHAALLLQLIHRTEEARFSTRVWPMFKVFAGLLFLRGMRRRMVWAEAFGQLSALREVQSVRQDLRDDSDSLPVAMHH
jgi:glycosyltransferase involved in cell wall biosynthesis